jgi:hypothetical protein
MTKRRCSNNNTIMAIGGGSIAAGELVTASSIKI